MFSMYDCLVIQEGAFIEEGNFVEKWFFRHLRRLAMLKIDFFLLYAAFRAWNICGLEDVLRCCKGLVLALRLINVLVWLRMFAAKIVVPVWMLIIWFTIEELGLRGHVNMSMGRSVFLHSALWSIGLSRSISCIFEDVSYSFRSFVTNFSLHASYYG